MEISSRAIKKAEEALGFYAEPTTWQRKGRKDNYVRAPYTEDHGERARAALAILLAAQQPSPWARLRAAMLPKPTNLGEFRPHVPRDLETASDTE